MSPCGYQWQPRISGNVVLTNCLGYLKVCNISRVLEECSAPRLFRFTNEVLRVCRAWVLSCWSSGSLVAWRCTSIALSRSATSPNRWNRSLNQIPRILRTVALPGWPSGVSFRAPLFVYIALCLQIARSRFQMKCPVYAGHEAFLDGYLEEALWLGHVPQSLCQSLQRLRIV
jgi:hypothetical protein